MLELWRLKSALKHAIARNRRSPMVTRLHALATFIDRAWHNHDVVFATNGECAVLTRLAAADFKTVVDVGANVGEWTLEVLHLWPHCRVYPFEVAPETFSVLARAISASGKGERVQPQNVGLSDKPGSARLYYYPEYDKLTSEAVLHQGFEHRVFDAKMITLDAFCDEHGIEHIDFLKVDVEGAEYRVLQGAAACLAAGRIDCIQFEFGLFGIETRTILRDFFDLLAPTHVIGKIFPHHVEFADYDWRMDVPGYANYLCVPRQRPDLIALACG